MKSIDIVRIFKTVASVAPLGDNKFRVKYGRNQEAIITVEAAQQSVQPTGVRCWKCEQESVCGGYCRNASCSEFHPAANANHWKIN